MKSRKPLPSVLAILTLGLLMTPSTARAEDSSTPPRLTSLPDEAFTEGEARAVVDWTVARPEVRSRLEGHRWRLLSVGSDRPKGRLGPYRRATLYVRNYDAGLTHRIFVDLSSGRLQIADFEHGAAAPTEDEIQEAVALVRSDPQLQPLVQDSRLELMGGFALPAGEIPGACVRDLCVQLAFMQRAFTTDPVRFILVNLSRRVIEDRSYFKTSRDPSTPGGAEVD
jgi:hypothetical protein